MHARAVGWRFSAPNMALQTWLVRITSILVLASNHSSQGLDLGAQLLDESEHVSIIGSTGRARFDGGGGCMRGSCGRRVKMPRSGGGRLEQILTTLAPEVAGAERSTREVGCFGQRWMGSSHKTARPLVGPYHRHKWKVSGLEHKDPNPSNLLRREKQPERPQQRQREKIQWWHKVRQPS